MPRFVNFDSFKFIYDRLKQPLTVKYPVSNTIERDNNGLPISQPIKSFHGNGLLLTNTNPNLTYMNDTGGQQSTVDKIWESRHIKNAPKGTTVIDKDNNAYKVVSSTKVSGTNLWYYQLQSVGDRN